MKSLLIGLTACAVLASGAAFALAGNVGVPYKTAIIAVDDQSNAAAAQQTSPSSDQSASQNADQQGQAQAQNQSDDASQQPSDGSSN